MNERGVGESFLSDRTRFAGALHRLSKVLLNEIPTAHRHDEVSRGQRDQHACQFWFHDERDNIGGNEKGDAVHNDANLFIRALLNDTDLASDAGGNLASRQVVEEGSILPQDRSKVFLTQSLSQTFAGKVPAESVDVDETKVGDSNVDDHQDLGVDVILVGRGIGFAVDFASRRVQSVDELSENNRHDREGDSGCDCSDETSEQDAHVCE